MTGEGEMRSRLPALPRLAHELNNDLGIIAAECDLLELSHKNDSSTLARIQAIKEAARRMAEKIQASCMGQSGLRVNSSNESNERSSH